MRFVIQRVTRASVSVDGSVVSEIGSGFLVLVGVFGDDTRADAEKMVKKLCGLRIFADENGKTNLSLADVGGELLMVSQFTLCADCRHGNRPSFTGAGPAVFAEEMFDYICGLAEKIVPSVKRGVFGADMKVELLNDGPFTIILDSKEWI
ncbi:MAG: D-tyrosyl-tRNA(Tyr) deacylase [Firmicutes bacterium]|nr:D-tyrosyl-tRNA(Tyr) deacylase [Bacillota bacterium]